MSQSSQQAVTHVLQQDSKVLDSLLNKLNQLTRLNSILAASLEEKLIPHCQVANYANDSLTVIVYNAIWATQFRFLIPSLIPRLRNEPELAQLKNIVCKITPQIGLREAPSSQVIRLMPKLSFASAEIILHTAQSIKHEKLKSVMERLAKNTQEENKI